MMSNFRLQVLSAVLGAATASVQAQDVVTAVPHAAEAATILGAELQADGLQDSTMLSLPQLTSRGTLPYYPYWSTPLGGFADWQLHSGLNASLSASAIIGLGRHGGSGFANSLSLMYAGNITPKLSYAVGGYTSFLEYGGIQARDAGLTALLNYRLDEHWEASAFVQKSVVQPRLSPQLYWLDDVGDKIGASVRYHFTPSLSIGISVWNYNRDNPWTYSNYRPSTPGLHR